MNSSVRIILQIVPNRIPQHFVDNNRLTLDVFPDFSLNLSKSLSESTTTTGIKEEAVLGFNLPQTDKNQAVFESIVDTGNSIDNNDTFIQVWTIIEGSLSEFDRLYVLSATTDTATYNCELRKSLMGWKEPAKSLTLNQINFGEFEYSFANIQSNRLNEYSYQNGGTGYLFPDANFGGLSGKKSVSIGYLRPWFHALAILQKGFEQLGITFRSSFLESTTGRKMITYILDQNYFSDTTLLSQRQFSANNADLTNKIVKFRNVDDPGGNYRAESGKYQAAGVYDWRAEIGLLFTANNGQTNNAYVNVALIIERKNGDREFLSSQSITVSTSSEEFREISFNHSNVILNSGDSIFIEIDKNNSSINQALISLSNTPKKAFLEAGDIVDLNAMISNDYSLYDFLLGIIHLTSGGNLFFDSTSKILYHYPPFSTSWNGENIEGFFEDYSNEPIILDQRIIRRSEIITNAKSDAARYVLYAFKNSTDKYIESLNLSSSDEPHSFKLDRGTQFQNRTEVNRNPFFEPTINADVFLSNSATTTPLDLPFLIDNDKDEISYNIAPRILLAHKPEELQSNIYNSFNSVVYFLEDTATNLSYAYQKANLVPRSTQTEISERLTFGGHSESLYNRFIKAIQNAKLHSSIISLKAILAYTEYKETNFQGLYRLPINGKSTFARLIAINSHNPDSLFDTELTLRLENYRTDNAIVTTINEPTFNNNFNINISTVSLCVRATLVDNIDSPISVDVFEYSTNTTGALTLWLPYTEGQLICNEDSLTFRRRLQFSDGAPNLNKTRTFTKNSICANSAAIELNVSNGNLAVAAIAVDSINSNIVSDVWTYIKGSDPVLPYVSGSVIDSMNETIVFSRIITFDNCSPINLEATHIPPLAGEECANYPTIECTSEFGTFIPFINTTNVVSEITMVVWKVRINDANNANTNFFNYDGFSGIECNSLTVRALIKYRGSCEDVVLEKTFG